MSRGKSVIKNTLWEMGYYLVVIIFGFLAPRYIILIYGSEVNGLSSTITQILNIILILQAGATTAAIYSLYKPIADNNLVEVCKNVAYAESFFKKISYTFFALMTIVAILAPFLINTKLSKLSVCIAFVIMGLKSFVDLYFTAKFRIVFTAYQEKFYISIATLIEQIIYYTLVFVTIFTQGHFLMMYVWFLLGCIVKVIYLEVIYKKRHPHIVTKKYKNENGKIGDRNYALANEVSHSIVNSSITIILSFMYSLEETSVYSVYALVSQALNLVATAIYSSFVPSFGNLMTEENRKSASRVFSIFQYIYIMLNTFLMMGMLFLVVPFVEIYTSGASDISYINYTLATMLALNGILSAYRIPYNVVVSSCGFFRETWLQPVISAVICIIISVILGKIDYAFVVMGNIIFYFINFVYQHIKLKRLVPWLIHKKVFFYLLISFGGLILTDFLNAIINFPVEIQYWFIYAIIFSICAIVYLILSSMIFVKTDLFQSVKYVKGLIR